VYHPAGPAAQLGVSFKGWAPFESRRFGSAQPSGRTDGRLLHDGRIALTLKTVWTDGTVSSRSNCSSTWQRSFRVHRSIWCSTAACSGA